MSPPRNIAPSRREPIVSVCLVSVCHKFNHLRAYTGHRKYVSSSIVSLDVLAAIADRFKSKVFAES
jgi:hypothetical protein